MPKRNESEGVVCGFIQKLWDILQNSDFDKILLWNSSGTSFAILNPSRLESSILPTFFRHSKLKSFVRQLNMYGFKKSQRAKEHLAFSNPDFRRDQENKLPFIRRKIAKRSRTPPSPADRMMAELEDLRDTPNDVSVQEQFISSNGWEVAASKEMTPAEVVKEDHQCARSSFEIRSYGRLLGEGRCFVPFVSPYSYASIKSEEKVETGEGEEQSFLEMDLFKNGSTDAQEAWPYGFTSCEYFI